MKKIIFFIAALILLQSFAQAQKLSGVIRGTLQDSTTNIGLQDATISVIKEKDSALISFTVTSSSGYFEIKKLDSDNYVLLVSYQGFESLKKPFTISAEKPEIDFGQLRMDRDYKALGEVVVRDEAPIKVKGDTIAYNANAFKTKPNATVEDLLKKLPGVQVERDGTVKAQGEQVQKVYVDGKEFFGTDPKMATKNLNADMIDEVEVYDDMSDQAKFNKIDDGSRTKAINLKLKKDKKRGTFGQVSAGYGTDDRYTANLRTNFFKGATQVSVLASANNANRLGFGTTDFLGMSSLGGGGGMGGGMMRSVGVGAISFGGGNNAGNSGGGGNGITSSWSAGINYNDVWNKFLDISSSYNINNTTTTNNRKAFRQTSLTDSSINRDQNSFSKNDNSVNRANVRLNYNVNDRNSIIYSSNVSLQNNDVTRSDAFNSVAVKGVSAYLLNETVSDQQFIGDGVNWNNNLIWRKKFSKPGRTFSLNFSNTYARNNTDGFNKSALSDYSQSGAKVKDSIINQLNMRKGNTDNYGLSLSYTQPVGRDKIWELNYGYNNNQSISDRKTSDFNSNTDEYDLVNTALSNFFANKNELNRFGTNFKVIKKKYNYQLGIAAQRALLLSDNRTKGTILKETYTNLFPNASFNYNFARSRTLRFNYRGRTNQPSIGQLQDVVDVSNPANYTTGNPALKQEFANSFTLGYNFFDISRFRNLFTNLTFSNTYNKIVNSTQQLGFGRQLTRPENVDGVYNISGNINYGWPINKLKGGNMNMTTRINYNRDANLVDGRKNFIKNFTFGEDLRLNYNYKEKLDLGVSAGINYTSAKYTINKAQNTSYFTHVYSVDATYTFSKGFILSSDFDFTANSGQAAGFAQDYTMWNASFAKQLFKNKRGEIRLSVFDILDQNISVLRNVGDNYVEDVQNSVLKRYFMLSFQYKINRMGGKSMNAGQQGRGRNVIMQ